MVGRAAGRWRRRGFLLPASMVLMLVVFIAWPALVRILQRESIDTVREVDRSVSHRVALAGEQKVLAYLARDPQAWMTLVQTGTLAGYVNDVEYEEPGQGFYKVHLSSGPSFNQITMLVTAVNDKRVHPKALRCTYARPPVGAFTGSAYTDASFSAVGRTPQLHWGPIYAMRMYLTANTVGLYYPRKIAMQSISPLDTLVAEPNTNNQDYWAYQTGLQVRQGYPDLEYYRARARATLMPGETADGRIVGGYRGGLPAVASPPGSGYFMTGMNKDYEGDGVGFVSKTGGAPGYVFSNSTGVIFIDGTNTAQSVTGTSQYERIWLGTHTFLDVEAFIPWTKVEIYGPGAGVVQATIPAQAQLEYQHPTAGAVWSAGGATGMMGVWMSPGRCCYTINDVALKGMLVSAGTNHPSFMGSQRGVLVGGIFINSTVFTQSPWSAATAMSTQGYDVYFDETLAKKLRLIAPISFVSRKEVTPQW